MAAIAAETARSARASGDVVSGALLAAGAAALFVGTLFYARLTPELGLPALPAERTQALADALKLGPQALALAGGFAFLGDCLLLAACIVLASRRRRAGDLEAAGWALMAVSVALAMVFDSMTAALFWPLAHVADSAPVRCDQVVVRLSVRRRQRALWAWLHRCPVRGHAPQRAAAAAARVLCRNRHRSRSGDQRARRGAWHAASAACHRPQRDVWLRDSRRPRAQDRAGRSGRRAMTGGSPR